MTVNTIDTQRFFSLPRDEQVRIMNELRMLDIDPHNTCEVYTDESGKVVGALRYVRDDQGVLVVCDNDAVVEGVGTVPTASIARNG